MFTVVSSDTNSAAMLAATTGAHQLRRGRVTDRIHVPVLITATSLVQDGQKVTVSTCPCKGFARYSDRTRRMIDREAYPGDLALARASAILRTHVLKSPHANYG